MIRKGFLFVLVSALAIAQSRSTESTGSSSATPNNGGGVYSQPAPDTILTEKENHYSQPIIENPSYDPSLYTSFVPQDAVQQYVSHYGGPYGAAPTYFGQSGDPSFAVQSGYEGYLVPSLSPYGAPAGGDAFSSFAKIAPAGYGYVKSLIPVAAKIFFGVIAKVAIVAVSTLGIVAAGGFVTSLLCTFTPLCKLSFAGIPFLKLKDTAKQLTSSLESELTQDRVKRAAEFVRMALEKYNELQSEFKTTEKSAPKVPAVAVEEEQKQD